MAFLQTIKSINWSRIFTITAWVLVVSGLGILFGFTASKQAKQRVRNIVINIDHNADNFFVDKKDILKTLNDSQGDTLINRMLKSISLSALEYTLEQNRYLQNVEVYADLKGNLYIDALQREPVLRIINSSSRSYYLDVNGRKMPLSDKYTAKVVVANGNIPEGYGEVVDSVQTPLLKSVYAVWKGINADKFWKAFVIQIYVNEKSEICLVPRVGKQLLIIGNEKDIKGKLARLMLFYEKAMPRVGWDTYKTLDASYNDQIVAIKDTIL